MLPLPQTWVPHRDRDSFSEVGLEEVSDGLVPSIQEPESVLKGPFAPARGYAQTPVRTPLALPGARR